MIKRALDRGELQSSQHGDTTGPQIPEIGFANFRSCNPQRGDCSIANAGARRPRAPNWLSIHGNPEKVVLPYPLPNC